MTIIEKINLAFLRAIIPFLCIIPYGPAVAIGRTFGRLASLFVPSHMKISAMQVRATLDIDDADEFMKKEKRVDGRHFGIRYAPASTYPPIYPKNSL